MVLGIRTEKRVPEEDSACFDTTTDFINPRIVKCHPDWLVSNVAWLRSFPLIRVFNVAVSIPHPSVNGQTGEQ